MKKTATIEKTGNVSARFNSAVTLAVVETFRDMLQAKIQSGEPKAMQINQASGSCSETTSIISFVGEVSGALMLKCSNRGGAAIASRMLGVDVGPGSDEMKDALGELLNIIIGTAKSHFSLDSKFRISIPTTIIGQNYSLYVNANTGNNVSLIPFHSGMVNIELEIYLT